MQDDIQHQSLKLTHFDFHLNLNKKKVPYTGILLPPTKTIELATKIKNRDRVNTNSNLNRPTPNIDTTSMTRHLYQMVKEWHNHNQKQIQLKRQNVILQQDVLPRITNYDWKRLNDKKDFVNAEDNIKKKKYIQDSRFPCNPEQILYPYKNQKKKGQNFISLDQSNQDHKILHKKQLNKTLAISTRHQFRPHNRISPLRQKSPGLIIMNRDKLKETFGQSWNQKNIKQKRYGDNQSIQRSDKLLKRRFRNFGKKNQVNNNMASLDHNNSTFERTLGIFTAALGY